MRFAFAGKAGRLGASGVVSSARARLIRSPSANAPTPSVQRLNSSRRDHGASFLRGRNDDGSMVLIQKEELVGQQQGLRVLFDRAHRGRRGAAELRGRVPLDQ